VHYPFLGDITFFWVSAILHVMFLCIVDLSVVVDDWDKCNCETCININKVLALLLVYGNDTCITDSWRA